MEQPVYCVQFVSRDALPDDLSGYRTFDEYRDVRMSARLDIQKEGRKVRPVVAPPWPVNPSIGAVEASDPLEEEEWPSYVLTTGSIDLPDPATFGIETLKKLLHMLREFTWCSFTSMPELKQMGDQRVSSCGCRRSYVSDMADINGSPFQHPSESYTQTAEWQPIGPGFAALPYAGWFGNRPGLPHSLYMVWSRAIALRKDIDPTRDLDRVRKRLRCFKLARNGRDEMDRAREYSGSGDVKECVRFAANGVEATLRYYASEWGIRYPGGRLVFHQKIDDILMLAGRISYEYFAGPKARILTHLYRARNAQHEGACDYRDLDTGEIVEVTLKIAREFLEAAEEFLRWLPSQA